MCVCVGASIIYSNKKYDYERSRESCPKQTLVYNVHGHLLMDLNVVQYFSVNGDLFVSCLTCPPLFIYTWNARQRSSPSNTCPHECLQMTQIYCYNINGINKHTIVQSYMCLRLQKVYKFTVCCNNCRSHNAHTWWVGPFIQGRNDSSVVTAASAKCL